MSSRIIVKNLPKKITEEKFREHFSKVGELTDAKLKFTKEGKFRQFGFIGYKNETEANKAIEYFNNTYINASKLIVENCKPLNDLDKKNKPWSKYSKKQPIAAKNKKETKKSEVDPEKGKSQKLMDELLGPLKDDAEFKEFVEATKKIKSKENIWSNDITFNTNSNENDPSSKLQKKKKKKTVDDDNDSNDEEDINDFTNFTLDEKTNKITATKNENKKVGETLLKDENNNNKKKSEKNQNDDSAEKKVESSTKEKKDEDEEENFENGRLFVRNLCYSCKEEDLEKLFEPYGPIVETSMPIDTFSKVPKGFAHVTFMFPEKAIKAHNDLDGSIFQGRMLHILPAKTKKESNFSNSNSYKTKKELEQQKTAQSQHNWNTLFLNQDSVANLMVSKYGVTKSELFNAHTTGHNANSSIAVKLAVGETQIVNEMRKFLVANGVHLDAFNTNTTARSKTVILIKNLPSNTTPDELKELFEKCRVQTDDKSVKKLVLPEYGIAAIVEFAERQEARDAFRKLAYKKFKTVPIYLEWAPENVFKKDTPDLIASENKKENCEDSKPKVEEKNQNEEEMKTNEIEIDEKFEDNATLFVKNLNFDTTEGDLQKLFGKIGKCKATIARKVTPNKETLSMGYGFIRYVRRADAIEAIKSLQEHILDNHHLELKMSTSMANNNVNVSQNRRLVNMKNSQEKATQEKTSKILVRNIPFEAKAKEIHELFSVFGQLKYVRLPKKVDGNHRGFGFVDFVTISDAERAFEALSFSTHLFGRRLVLEWTQPDQEQDVDVLRQREEQIGGSSARKKLKKSKILDDLERDFDKKYN